MDIGMPEEAKRKRIEVFCCYARKDQSLLLELKTHLTPLQREGLITCRADLDIGAGAEWEQEIHRYLNAAQFILLLISPDFLASDYCYGVEMQRALERHTRGEARVIPIIFRPTDWQRTPLGKLQALPKDAKPITIWQNQDEAFFNVAVALRDAIEAYLAEEQAKEIREAHAHKTNEQINPVPPGGVDQHQHTPLATLPQPFPQTLPPGASSKPARRPQRVAERPSADTTSTPVPAEEGPCPVTNQDLADAQTGAPVGGETVLMQAQAETIPPSPTETGRRHLLVQTQVGQSGSSLIREPASEQPVDALTSERLILLPPTKPRFAMSPYQVTNREFQLFLSAHAYWRRGNQCRSDGKVDSHYLAHWTDTAKNIPQYPVVNVSWYAAEAYVNWLSGQRHQRLRLPTQEEWEIAARCARTAQEWWREEIVQGRVNYAETEGEIRGVRSFGANRYGLYHILGNAYELCSSSQGGVAGYGGAAHSSLRELMTPLPLDAYECREDVSFRFVQDVDGLSKEC